MIRSVRRPPGRRAGKPSRPQATRPFVRHRPRLDEVLAGLALHPLEAKLGQGLHVDRQDPS